MDLLTVFLQQNDKFLILMARLSGLAFAPIFSTRGIPALWKGALALILSFLAWKLGVADDFMVPESFLAYTLIFISEFLIGFILALMTQFFFAAVQLAGQIIDTQMGFGIVNVIDPMSGVQAPLLGNFKYILALLVYLQIDGHHLFLQALFESFQFIPIGSLSLRPELYQSMISLFGNIFELGFKLSLPLVGALLAADFILGIMSRTIPQMNIFMVGMPAKILLGFAILIVVIPFYVYLLNTLLLDLIQQTYKIMSVLV